MLGSRKLSLLFNYLCGSNISSSSSCPVSYTY